MKAWESIVNRTRDIFRAALTWMQSPGDVHKVHCFLSYAVAFSYSLKDHVTWEEDLKMELNGLLQKKELEAVMASLHWPNYVIQIMSEIIQNWSLSGMEKVSMDLNITQFHDNLRICEHLFKTPFLCPTQGWHWGSWSSGILHWLSLYGINVVGLLSLPLSLVLQPCSVLRKFECWLRSLFPYWLLRLCVLPYRKMYKGRWLLIRRLWS
jgi:hypothetical protein